MKHSLFILMFITLFCSSCSYTPEERAEKVVKDYISAIRDNDYRKESSLTYEHEYDYAVTEGVDMSLIQI